MHKESWPLSAGWTPYTLGGSLARAKQSSLLEPLALTRPWNNRATGRGKACLGGKPLGPLTWNNSFIQKLLVCEFPPSFNQARKPSLMGTTHFHGVGSVSKVVPSWWAVGMGSNGDTYRTAGSVSSTAGLRDGERMERRPLTLVHAAPCWLLPRLPSPFKF